MFSFGKALEYLKEGRAVTRHGWNGKGQKIWMERGLLDMDEFKGLPPLLLSGVPTSLFDAAGDGIVTVAPYLCILTSNGVIQKGWLASQTDMLAEDWMLTEILAN